MLLPLVQIMILLSVVAADSWGWIAGMAILAMLLFLASWWSAEWRFSKHADALGMTIDQLTNGDFRVRTGRTRGTKAIRDMAQRLERLAEALEQQAAHRDKHVAPVPAADETPLGEEDKYRAIFQVNPQPIWVHDVETFKILAANPAAVRFYGYSAEQFLNFSVTQLVLPEDVPRLIERLVAERDCAPGERAEGVWRHRLASQEVIDVEVTTHATLFAGRPARVVYPRNVTVEWRAREEISHLNRKLQQRVEELQTLLKVIPIGIGIARDRECSHIDTNPHFANLLGISTDSNASLSGPTGERPTNFTCYHEGRLLEASELPLQTAARECRRVTGFDLEVVHDDGRTISLLNFAAPLLDERGAPRGAVGAFIDISERKQAEREQRRLADEAMAERTLLTAVLQQMPAGVLVAAAPSGELLLGNVQVERIIRDSYAGIKSIEEYAWCRGFRMDGSEYAPHEWPLARSILYGDVSTGEEAELVRGDGTRVFISQNAAPVYNADRKIVAGVVAFYDVTARKAAEELSRLQQAELAHLSRVSAAGQMAAGLAHELNQPLAAILYFTGVCTNVLDAGAARDGAGSSSMLAEAVEGIAAETKRAGEIIRRLRGFVRRQEPNVASLDINELVRESVRLMDWDLKKAGVQPTLVLASDLSHVNADAVQVVQVMVNLLRNAMEAMESTPRADRAMRVETARPPGDGGVRVRVTDNGSGLSKEEPEKIFKAFVSSKVEGLGIGLTISRAIIENHCGRLTARANDGAGATFEFTLPDSPEEQTPGSPAADAGNGGD